MSSTSTSSSDSAILDFECGGDWNEMVTHRVVTGRSGGGIVICCSFVAKCVEDEGTSGKRRGKQENSSFIQNLFLGQ